jgi:hypothetical protein
MPRSVSELDARLFELEGVLLEASSLAVNLQMSEPDRARELRDRLVVPVDMALAACRELQKDPWTL